MKLLYSFLFVLLISCNQHPLKTTPNPSPEIPQALEDKKSADFSIVSKSRVQNNLIDELYEELLQNNTQLQEIESGIKDINAHKQDSLSDFETFLEKNTDYYRNASHYMASLRDSSLKKKIEQILVSSNKTLEIKTAVHKSLIQQIENKSLQFADLHTALKIVTTLAVMEKYQQEHLPSVKPIQKILTGYTNLVVKTDSLINQ
jgi:glutathione peroxidase-family protein